MQIGYTYVTVIKTGRKTLYYGGKKTATEFVPGYFGSGRVVKTLRRTGKAKCTVSVNAWHNSLLEINAAERQLIADLRAKYGKSCVNINHGGDGFTPEMSNLVKNTPSFRAKRDANRRKFWENPNARKAAAERTLERLKHSPEIIAAFVKATHTPEAREKGRKTNATLWLDPAHRAKRVAVLKSENRCKAVSAGQTEAWKDPEIRKRRASALAEKHKDPEFLARRKKAVQEANQRPELKAKRKAVAEALWSDPERKQRRVAMLKEKMNTPEAIAKRVAGIKAAWARRKGLL